MAYQGHHNGQANANYGADFNAYTDASFGDLFNPVPDMGVDNAFYGSTIGDLDFLAPIEGNTGNLLHNRISLPMPVANQAVQIPTPSSAFYQQEHPVAPMYAPAQASVSATGTANGSSLASGSNADSSPAGRQRFTPSHAPGTPIVLDPWKYYRTVAERQQLKLKEGKIPRITRKKKGAEHIDPEQYYGPPVKAPEAWGPIDPKTNRPIFEYTKYGELYQGRTYDVAQLKMYLYDRRLKTLDPSDWAPRKKLSTERRVEGKVRGGLTLWLGWPAAQADHRYPRSPGTQTCRYKDCPYSTIKQGLPRVILDERMNDQGLELDPFYNAGYIHLYCLEKNFDLVDMIKNLDFRIDDRSFKKEEYNLFSLTGRDGKLDLTNTYHYWWKREFRRSQQAKANGRSRDRSNYEESSLGAALLKCKLSHESSARAKTRLDRDGVDVTKYWGDLDLYADLRYQYKLQKEKDEEEGEGPSHRHEQNRATAPSRPKRSVQATSIASDSGNTFAYPQYPDSHVQYTQQYAGYGTAATTPASYDPQMTRTHQVSHHDIHVLNQPYHQMPPVQPAVSQWGGLSFPQPGMAGPSQAAPQQIVSPRGRKRSREVIDLEDESLGGATTSGLDETRAKKACHNHRGSHALPYGMDEIQAWNDEIEVTQEPQDVVTLDGIPSFDFNLPQVTGEQTVEERQAELGSEIVTEEANNNLPEPDGKSTNAQMEEPAAELKPAPELSTPPEWSTDEQLLNSDDLFDSNITPDEFDSIFGKEDTTPPAAEEPAQEASFNSEDVEEPREEEPKVPEVAKESPTPASPKPSSPRSPSKSPSGLSSSRWA
ncbi:hypothetical protein SLS62_006239 [Diatrype stigma]|uniref:Uncharacterized protein n=1 Tax=Diatrype stigma TaxID=117547 RepID=A0AAN9UYT2_9PEZI